MGQGIPCECGHISRDHNRNKKQKDGTWNGECGVGSCNCQLYKKKVINAEVIVISPVTCPEDNSEMKYEGKATFMKLVQETTKPKPPPRYVSVDVFVWKCSRCNFMRYFDTTPI
jgi:hypothetical protein